MFKDAALKAKARRRIRRFIATGEHQPRVYETDDPSVFEYKAVHHVRSLYFKRGRFGRLKLVC